MNNTLQLRKKKTTFFVETSIKMSDVIQDSMFNVEFNSSSFWTENYKEDMIARQLIHAKKQLNTTDIAFSTRCICYLKVCCRLMQQSQHPFWENQASFLNLLQQLQQKKADWYKTCFISQDGSLDSSDPDIQKHLQYLDSFVSYCTL